MSCKSWEGQERPKGWYQITFDFIERSLTNQKAGFSQIFNRYSTLKQLLGKLLSNRQTVWDWDFVWGYTSFVQGEGPIVRYLKFERSSKALNSDKSLTWQEYCSLMYVIYEARASQIWQNLTKWSQNFLKSPKVHPK